MSDRSKGETNQQDEDAGMGTRTKRTIPNQSYKEPSESSFVTDGSDMEDEEEGEGTNIEEKIPGEEEEDDSFTIHSEKKKPKTKKVKSNGTTKTVSYEAVTIPFGETTIETVLSYRVDEGVEQALVKYKYQSYHHVEWVNRDIIEATLTMGKNRFKKLKEQYEVSPNQFDEPFNPTFLEVDRVIDEGELDSDDGYFVYVLVKWEGLPYESATWEKLDFVKELANDKYREFVARQEHPGNSVQVHAPRPAKGTFTKLEISPKFKNDNQLRDYQLEGLNWLTYCWYNRQSSIMADEMGLGKTVQSVSFIYHIYRTCAIRGPFLVVAPLSTIPHWEREFRAWTDLNVIVYHGSSVSRNLIVDTEYYYKDSDGSRLSKLHKFDVIITSYEMTLNGVSQLRPIPWRAAIFDEAHRLKNRNSKVLEVLKSYNLEHRVLLTGTPLQNSVAELFSLLNFLDPVRFVDEEAFLNQYDDLKSSAEVTELQDLLKPLMLRRFKEDVEKSIPSKEETVVEVELTSVQKSWYRAILERNFTYIRKGCKGNGPSLNNIMMELRKCCNHPFLITGAEESILNDDPMKGAGNYFDVMIRSSGKMVLMDKLLHKLKENGHKVLIFSQMTRVLDLLNDYLAFRGYKTERIDGGVKSQDRQIAIDRFSTSKDSFAFLLCTRAGGVGINLTAADTVIIFDSDWNPQNDLQAQARVHRIGQTKPVKIYRLLCANTYERQMFDRANLKLGLDKAVMQKMDGSYQDAGSNTPTSTGLSKKEVEDLLKLGAYGALLDDSESAKFYEEDIDSILQRRSTVVKYEGNQKGTAFSKASFSTFDQENTTDLNDPDFWDKWAAKADLDPDTLVVSNPLILDEPRTRKRTARFEYLDPVIKSKDVIAMDEGEDSDYEAETEVKGYKGWTVGERAKLERNLMIYGLSNWPSLKVAFNKRSISDLRACTRQLIMSLIKFEDPPSDLVKVVDDIQTALKLDQQRHDELTYDYEKLYNEMQMPYPDATKTQASEFKSFLISAPPEYFTKSDRQVKNLLMRIQVMYQICELIVPKDYEALLKFDVPDLGKSLLPSPWWEPRMDRDLLVGLAIYGYHQYDDIRSDPQLIFSKLKFEDMLTNQESEDDDTTTPTSRDQPKEKKIKIEETEEAEETLPNPPDSNGTLEWPAGTVLGPRLRKLVSVLLKKGKGPKVTNGSSKMTYQQRMIQSIRSNNEVTLDIEIELDPTWSAKEHKSFVRTLSSFGLETTTSDLNTRLWARFRMLGGLHNKDDEALEQYLYHFMQVYHLVLNNPSNVDISDKNGDVVQFLDAIMPTLKSNDTKVTIDSPTGEKSKRVIKRAMVMHTLRHQVYYHPNRPTILRRIRKPQGFPSWWSDAMDEPFLYAIVTYGVSKEDLIYGDKDLPFHGLEESDWPKENVLMKRLDQFIEMSHRVLANPFQMAKKALAATHSNDGLTPPTQQPNHSVSPHLSESDFNQQLNKPHIKIISPSLEINGVKPALLDRPTKQLYVVDSDNGPILTTSPKPIFAGHGGPLRLVKLEDGSQQPKITMFFNGRNTCVKEERPSEDYEDEREGFHQNKQYYQNHEPQHYPQPSHEHLSDGPHLQPPPQSETYPQQIHSHQNHEQYPVQVPHLEYNTLEHQPQNHFEHNPQPNQPQTYQYDQPQNQHHQPQNHHEHSSQYQHEPQDSRPAREPKIGLSHLLNPLPSNADPNPTSSVTSDFTHPTSP